MLYFVQTFNTYSLKNRACKKLIDFVQKFERVLIKDELSLDTLKEEIRIKVDEINAEHPKLKKLRFSAGNITGGVQRIDATVETWGVRITFSLWISAGYVVSTSFRNGSTRAKRKL